MRRRVASLFLLTVALAACGGETPTTTNTTPLKTETYGPFTIVDPMSCNCGDGIATYTINVVTAGSVDATATWSPADATVIARILDESFGTVLATSTPAGTSAKFSRPIGPGTYRIQVFLAPGGARTATFQLSVTHP